MDLFGCVMDSVKILVSLVHNNLFYMNTVYQYSYI